MQPKKILFATVPVDGHFNPLTGIAMHLKSKGHDVRWYTQDVYREKLQKMGIPHYPFVTPPQANQYNFEKYFPLRATKKSQVAKLQYDLEHLFVRRTMESFKDIKDIYENFPFDLVVGDIFATALPVIKAKLGVPVVSVGVVPVMESSRDLAPSGLGLPPASTWTGKLKHSLMRFISDKYILARPTKIYRAILKEQGIEVPTGNLFDILYRSASMVLQSGTPGFEYQRSDLNPNIRFVGPLMPHTNLSAKSFRLNSYMLYDHVVLVTQGTVEKDPEKILVPTIEAFKDTNTLVIATTGGSGTWALKQRFPQSNVIIEDFIPFDSVMNFCDAYVTNGGYGGVMLGIKNKLPLVVAGVHEGKNEICARVSHFKIGINLRTDRPTKNQIFKAVNQVLMNKDFKRKVSALSDEFSQYDPNVSSEIHINRLLSESVISINKMREAV